LLAKEIAADIPPNPPPMMTTCFIVKTSFSYYKVFTLIRVM